MAAKTSVSSLAKTKAPKASARSRPNNMKNLSSLKATKVSPALKYPKLSAKTMSGKIGSKTKSKSFSSISSSLKSFISAAKKTKKSGGATPTFTKKATPRSGSPAFFGPIDSDTLL